MATAKGKLLFGTMIAKLMKNMKKDGDGETVKAAGFELTPELMQMMGGFTVVRLSGMMGMMGATPTKEELLNLNAKLNKIKKPKK